MFVVSFDGFASTPVHQSLLFAVRGGTGAGSWAGLSLHVAGFGLFCVALAGAATLTARILGDTACSPWTVSGDETRKPSS